MLLKILDIYLFLYHKLVFMTWVEGGEGPDPDRNYKVVMSQPRLNIWTSLPGSEVNPAWSVLFIIVPQGEGSNPEAKWHMITWMGKQTVCLVFLSSAKMFIKTCPCCGLWAKRKSL